MNFALGRTGSDTFSGNGLARGVDFTRRVVRGILVLVNVAAIVTLFAFFVTESIDDDLSFTPEAPIEGGLASVNMTVGLIEREAERHAWVSNEPSFMPGYWLVNMQSYQQGMMYGLSRFAYELADSLGRTRGATAVDPDLDRAAGLLRFPANVWIFDFEKTWTPVVTSEEQYLSAARALQSYNLRLAEGAAAFDPRPDSLYNALARIEADISSEANVLVEHVERVAAGVQPLETANEVFFSTKGRLYAYAMILRALGTDFSDIIEREGLSVVWAGMIRSLENGAVMHPVLIFDGEPGSMIIPSHVAELGFFALRVKTQMRDVMAVLREN